MIALDTNVIVRLVTNDDPPQARRAASLLESSATYLPKTVVLEVEWVLRSAYGLSPKVIHETFTKLLAVTGVRVEEPEVVSRALRLYAEGMDFADALHLCSSEVASSFATFDARLVKSARRLLPQRPVRIP